MDIMNSKKLLRPILLLLVIALAGSPAVSATLTMQERVEAQRAIEEVYWRHRIWPPENPPPKPPLSVLMPDEAIRARVETTLARSVALEVLWNRPVTAAQLQAELDRMTRHSRNPAMLGEIFEALGNDPLLLRECLARPILVDRLIEGWYARDGRFHGALREEIEERLRLVRGAADMKSLGGQYAEVEVIVPAREGEGSSLDPAPEAAGVLHPEPAAWRRMVARLARAFGVPGSDSRPARRHGMEETSAGAGGLAGRLPVGRISGIVEDDDAFAVRAVLSRDETGMRIATVRWPKRSFQDWWRETRRSLDAEGLTWETTGDANGSDAVPGGGFAPLSITAESCGDGEDDVWYPTYDTSPPEPRSQHTAVWTGAEMIVWGGWNGTDYLQSGGLYDPATDRWSPTSMGASVPDGRRAHTAVWTGSLMIVWGGLGAGGELQSGGRYNPATDTWTSISTGTHCPSPRWGHTAVFTGGQMIVWGGYAGGANLGDGGRYTLITNTWQPVSSTGAPSPRRYHTAVYTVGPGMIVWGGYATDPNGVSANTMTGAVYNELTDTWVRATSTAGLDPVNDPRRLHTAVGAWTGPTSGQMIVWGGFGKTNLRSGMAYDPWSDSWTRTEDNPGSGVPMARHKHTAVWTGSKMLVWGGSNGTIMLASGGEYDPASDTWDATGTAGVPQARWEHTAVWTGSEMLVWGGLYNTSYLDDGGRYDPGVRSWVPTSMMRSPAARSGHSAIWTGAEMVVWGGQNALGLLDTGSRYDPSTDEWRPTPVGSGQPVARAEHSTVWTGTEMIVWGGYDPNGIESNTGGRYDPGLDVWTPMSADPNRPSPRVRHTAVWTGDEMIVWGGEYAASPLETGGRYDPMTGRWTPTPLPPGEPAARSGHTAVWTGDEMIVWGGYGGGRLDTGGRYDPYDPNAVNGTWQPVTTATAPSPRDFHTAVWTGSEMIVWGGLDPNGAAGDGGLYDPASDQWTDMAGLSGTPAPRFNHTAVWTGKEMLVWGGDDAGGYTDTGGRFDPALLRWRPMSVTAGTPEGRDHHAAIWTGREMIIWGGEVNGTVLSSGGQYCAAGSVPGFSPWNHRDRRLPFLRDGSPPSQER